MLKQTILIFALTSIFLQVNGRQGPLPQEFWQKVKHLKFSSSSEERIPCGESIDINQRPFHAFVLYYGSLRCSASIINPNVVLTSATCCQGMNSDSVLVRVGSSQPSSNQGDIHDVQNIIIHPLYDDYNVENDICLLVLEKPIINPLTKPVDLPKKTIDIESGAPLIASGIGLASGDLIQLELSFVSDEICFGNYDGSLVANSMMCAIDLCDDLCNSHIGNPLTFNDVQVGLGSWGYGCANPDYPGVFTQVDAFLDFINENMF